MWLSLAYSNIMVEKEKNMKGLFTISRECCVCRSHSPYPAHSNHHNPHRKNSNIQLSPLFGICYTTPNSLMVFLLLLSTHPFSKHSFIFLPLPIAKKSLPQDLLLEILCLYQHWYKCLYRAEILPFCDKNHL